LHADDPELLGEAQRFLDRARTLLAQTTHDVVAWNEPRFPPSLLITTDAPPALWCRGDVAVLAGPAVALVGSRAASAAALHTAETLGADLAAAGIVVVSGLARGVDSAAHRGALRTGETVAVLGSGIDRVYPREHATLAAEIARRGGVLSEYPPGTPPLAFHFPMRNRLISGLSRAVVVVEANEKSGSLITAACALEQGREVMAVPGSVVGGRNRGAHALIRDGARIVESASDIIEELGLGQRGDGPARGLSAVRSVVSRDAALSRMPPGQPYDLDGLAEETGLSGVKLLPRLLEWELHGWVRRLEGGRFVRVI
jgi:DNA processing protein